MRVRVFVGLASAVLTPLILIACHGSDSIAPIPFVWSSVSSGTTQDLWSVWGISASDVWAVGWNGTILHYNGTSWSSVSSSTLPIDLYGVWGASASDVWAVGGGTTPVLHYNGTTWSSVTVPGGATQNLNSVWGTSASDVWAVGRGTTPVLHYNGTTWSSVSSPTFNYGGQTLWLNSVYGTSPSNVWAVGTFYYTSQSQFPLMIFHYDGTSWSSLLSGASAASPAIFAIWGSSASNIWALGGAYSSGDKVVRTIFHYDGTSWLSVSNALMTTPRAIWGTSASDVWSVGDDFGAGGIAHYDGVNWSSFPSRTTLPALNGVWGSSSSDVWAVGVAGTILHGSPPKRR